MPTRTMPRFVTQDDAAETLGVSSRTIRNLIARGELPAYRVGSRAIRIDTRDIERILTPIPTVNAGDHR